jgi:hypothetical protein
MIERVTGVLLDPGEAQYLARALVLLEKLLADNHSQPTARLRAVTMKLRKTTETFGATPESTGSTARNGRAVSPYGDDFRDDDGRVHNATIGTNEAARILGVTPNAVRDLARRHRLPRAERPDGRWLLDPRVVVALAEQRAARKAARRNR